MITILGPGGSGKTRLALEAAHSQAEQFHDGAWLVSLAPLSATQAIPAAIASALGLPLQEQPEPLQQLKDYLRAKNALLIVDSCEHLLEGAHLAVELLRAAPQLKVLATSRGRLNVQGEQVFPLGGLEVPPLDIGLELAHQCESIQLFVSAGQHARPGFDLSPTNLVSVAHICALVEGMPFGLLLAAAWVDTFSTTEVAAEIERDLDFLSSDWESVPARQRSLRATFDYSWRLLAEAEQQALRRLSVFRGGFNRQAAGQVAGASPHDLRVLVEKSMLERLPSGRYGIHELLRQYAGEKLGKNPTEESADRERHAKYYLGKLPGWVEALKDSRQGGALGEMDIDTGNLSVAWAWASKQGMVDDLSWGLEGFCLYYDLRARFQEGQLACQLTLENLSSREDTQELAKLKASLWTWQAYFLRLLGIGESIPEMLIHSQELLDKVLIEGETARTEVAFLLFVQGHCEPSLQAQADVFQQSIAVYREVDEPWWIARALCRAGEVANQIGNPELAFRYHRESLDIFQSLGDISNIANSLKYLSNVYAYRGDIDEALETIQSRGRLL